MQVVLDIPDSLAEQLIPKGQDASRTLYEDALVQAYRENRITGRELMEALGIETRYELDGFLKGRQVYIEYTWEQLQRDRSVMEEHLAAQAGKTASV